MRILARHLAATCLVGVVLQAAYAGGCDEYIVELAIGPPCGTFGYYSLTGLGVNDAGDVVGIRTPCLSSNDWAFYWPAGSSEYQLLPMPPGTTSSVAHGIDNDGRIVGTFINPAMNSGDLAFVIEGGPNGTFTAIVPPRGGNMTEGYALGNGEAIGVWLNNQTGPYGPFLWSDGTFHDLLPDLGNQPADARDINCAGAITGWVGDGGVGGPGTSAYIWNGGKVTELGPIPGGYNSVGRAINCAGQVAGYGRVPVEGYSNGKRRAFFWSNGEMVNLGILPGQLESLATCISPEGWVGGSSNGSPQGDGTFLWRFGVLQRLEDIVDHPEIDIGTIHEISESGVIVGKAKFDGKHCAMRLIPNRSPADLNCDHVVDAADLAVLIGEWGARNGAPTDINGDGLVDGADLGILLGSWGDSR